MNLPDGTRASTTGLVESTGLVVRKIRVDVEEYCPSSWITAIDWAAFATITVASFPQLECIVVSAKKGSEQEAAYMEHAHKHFESLSHEQGIELDVQDLRQLWRAPHVHDAPAATTIVGTATQDPTPEGHLSTPSASASTPAL